MTPVEEAIAMAIDIETRINEQMEGVRGEMPHTLLGDALATIKTLRRELELSRARTAAAGQLIAELTEDTAA